jgi:hypothetical protein
MLDCVNIYNGQEVGTWKPPIDALHSATTPFKKKHLIY